MIRGRDRAFRSNLSHLVCYKNLFSQERISAPIAGAGVYTVKNKGNRNQVKEFLMQVYAEMR